MITFGIFLLSVLVALAVIDFRTLLLPDFLTLPLILVGFGFSYWLGDIRAGLIGAVIGYAAFFGLELFYKRVRGIDGLGRGDAKLLAAGGAWCGWYGLAFIVLVASASGLIHALLLSHSQSNATEPVNGAEPVKLPFGPHLALGIFLTWLALFVLS